MRILIVDDEKLARTRMRMLLQDCEEAGDVSISGVEEASDALTAMQALQGSVFDLVLLDIHMPGADGLKLAAELRKIQPDTAIIFVTAHPQHAVQAFDVEAVDYLTKPVSEERMIRALQKAEQFVRQQRMNEQRQEQLTICHRGGWIKVPVSDVLCFRAVDKYTGVKTLQHEYLTETSLNELQKRYADSFVRIHRSALVARHCIASLEQNEYGWAVRLHGMKELLPVSRRQLPQVKEGFRV